MSKTAVVTGAASGLGRDIAAGLAAKGYTVYGTALSDAEMPSAPSVHLTRVDITDAAAVQTWAADIAEKSGGRVDLLISNAGVLTPGPLEALPLDEVRREFEVNTFAPLTVVNALLPQLRESRGRIVQISSISAVFPMPFNAPSAASKAAAEALMVAYRAELHSFGIDVTIIQPGSMLTGGPAKSAALVSKLSEAFTPEQQALYGDGFAKFAAGFNSGQASGMPSEVAAAQVIEIAEQQPAASVATIGDDAARIAHAIRNSTPEQLDAMRVSLI
ncbi:SDR family NAD(P)-dependent oxidoreductase [Microbacterium aquimaris]|uniref:SDR family NAD(P)-dependent oxidoreductase n=1 Tax=Microbacterium aquimaris TaxID=459816 RepID=A0ABU5N2H9_9MICO|nr:SDR family NAD(P)-dependent oxidoreductase [Microbacterium aquimaris]MDZ8160282.1 SDR family NAD(P)-dependent oxidoreductase [Microbacterium aquimaris]